MLKYLMAPLLLGIPLVSLSCTPSNTPFDTPIVIPTHHRYEGNDAYFTMENNSSNGQNRILSNAFYNQLWADSEFDKTKEVTVALIANKQIYTEIVLINNATTLVDIFANLYSFHFNTKDIVGITWISSFTILLDDQNYSAPQHGASTLQNYGDYYPLFWINHVYSGLGASNWSVSPGEIYEVSYDIGL